MRYAIQCKDKTSGVVGSFCYDETRSAAGEGLYAVSPVLPDLYELFSWARINEISLSHFVNDNLPVRR